MKNDPTAHYALARDIDAGATRDWNDGAGFLPIGDEVMMFMRSFDGRGHSITGLYIDRVGSKNIGLFGWVWGGKVKFLTTEILKCIPKDKPYQISIDIDEKP